jgi:glycosyltransferase involved in cell wall biosynthesis
MAIVARASMLHGRGAPWLAWLFLGSVTGLAVFAGLRGIVLHQNADREADASAGIETFGGSLGVDGARRLVFRWLLPAELFCLAVFLALIALDAPLAIVAAVLSLAVEWQRMRRGWTLPLFAPADQSHERYIPIVNNELYEVWLPLGLALQLAVEHPPAWLFVAAQILLFLPSIRTRLADVRRTLATLPASSHPTLGVSGFGKRARRPGSDTDSRVIIDATTWTVNGVNVFSANLARGLLQAGASAEVLLTEEATNLINPIERPMPRPVGVPFHLFPVARTDGWGMHWGAMVRYLEERAPCIYIPNSDWRHSCVCPRLSDNVVVVGIVHSDDPLHYDHVRRLGPYWNAVVAVSRAVAARTIELCPSVADRIATIPIGVRVPASRPRRPPEARVLRVIYHGILKQHQKRVLDFPRIVEAAVARGVPVELTLVGAGPDEAALRAASAPFVEQGHIRFLGVVSPDETAALLETQDVYLLASEFEGMPNALIEAMGRGCVPVVTRMTSGIPELVHDGENGFLVPIGDAAAFAQAFEALWRDPAHRNRMSINAYRTVRRSRFRVQDMVDAYRDVFARAIDDARSGRFVRPRGMLCPPPPEVAGVSLFPVQLPHVVPDVGAFPSLEDAEDYDDQLHAINTKIPRTAGGRPPSSARRSTLDGVRVYVSAPVWTPNGVNLWSEELVRGLQQAGLDARLLITEESTELVRIDGPRMARPTTIPVEELQLNGADNWGARWGAMVRTLDSGGPCIYVPNYDWRHSSVVPLLSQRVVVVAAAHRVDGLYTDHVRRLKDFLNGVVTTTRPVARHLRSAVPGLARPTVIPHGCVVPDTIPEKTIANASSMRIAVLGIEHGTPDQGPMEAVARMIANAVGPAAVVAVDPHPAVIGDLARAGINIVERPNREQWLHVCKTSDVMVARNLRDESERLMVEAMGYGCVGILTDPDPKDARLIRDRDTGIVDVPDRLLARIQEVMTNVAARMEILTRGHETARQAGYRADQMIDAHLELFERLLWEAGPDGGFRRPRGVVTPPPAQIDGTNVFPVEATHSTPYGLFPSSWDADRFAEEVGAWASGAGGGASTPSNAATRAAR